MFKKFVNSLFLLPLIILSKHLFNIKKKLLEQYCPTKKLLPLSNFRKK